MTPEEEATKLLAGELDRTEMIAAVAERLREWHDYKERAEKEFEELKGVGDQYRERIAALEAENERLRKLITEDQAQLKQGIQMLQQDQVAMGHDEVKLRERIAALEALIAALETELQQEREAHGRIEERWQAQVRANGERIAALKKQLEDSHACGDLSAKCVTLEAENERLRKLITEDQARHGRVQNRLMAEVSALEAALSEAIAKYDSGAWRHEDIFKLARAALAGRK